MIGAILALAAATQTVPAVDQIFDMGPISAYILDDRRKIAGYILKTGRAYKINKDGDLEEVKGRWSFNVQPIEECGRSCIR